MRQLIREQKMLLLVGAGVSMRVGYPSLDEYAQELVDAFEIDVSHLPKDDASAIAGFVKETLDEAGRLDEFHSHIERTFGPEGRRERYDSVHQALARANFRGIVTTNYDSILEDTVSDDGGRCEELDLCSPRSFAILNFLRATSAGRNRAFVLHLHGWFRSPQHLVITTDDYATRYGGYYEETEGTELRRDLDTMHRKVLWALLASYPVLFVGFSMRDPALRHFLDVIDKDFQRGRDLDHFAVMPASDGDEEDITRAELAKSGVSAIFYPVTPSTGPGVPDDHRALADVIFDLCPGDGRPLERTAGERFTSRWVS